jgi:hypothetical protein
VRIGRIANILLIISSLKKLFETMINDYKWLKLVLNHDKRCGTVGNDQERWGTLRDYGGRRSVTMGHDDLKMVTGR